jgi:hypothetical protein
MNFRLRIVTFISVPLIMGGVILMEDKRGNTIMKTEHPETIHAVLPLIDKDIPAVIETATFALG